MILDPSTDDPWKEQNTFKESGLRKWILQIYAIVSFQFSQVVNRDDKRNEGKQGVIQS